MPRTIVVDQKQPSACDSNAGTPESPLLTISRAAALAEPGDTVIVKSGIYRERIAPARGGTHEAPIAYIAPAGERVSVRGSDIFSPDWQSLPNAHQVFKAGIEGFSTLDTFNPYAIAMHGFRTKRTLGQVFVNGEMLTEMESIDQVLTRPATWTCL